jgi:hypothetical protein
MEIRLTVKNIMLALIIIFVVACAIAWAWIGVLNAESPQGPSGYTAVYLTSGDVYFGKFSWLPQPHMADAWYLNRTAGTNGETQLSVVPFDDAAWGPTGEIDFNPAQILFTAPIGNGSGLLPSLKGAAPSSPSEPQTQPPATPPPSASSTPAPSTNG